MKKSLIILLTIFLGLLPAMAQTTQEATVKCGQVVTLTPTPATGYHFVRWEDGNTDNPRQVEISSETSLFDYVAFFEANTYAISVVVKEAGTGSVEQASISGKYGSQVTLKAIESDPCYKFDHWENSAGTSLSTDMNFTYTIEDSAIIYAVFVEREFTVKATATHGTVSISVQ